MSKICKFFFTAAKIAPLFTAIAACSAVFLGYFNVQDQLDRISEIKAIELFRDYSLRIDSDTTFIEPNYTLDSNKNIDLNKIPLKYRLFAHYCLFIAESIFNLVGYKDAWKNTIEYILLPHIDFYEINNSVDSSLSYNFRNYYNELKIKAKK